MVVSSETKPEKTMQTVNGKLVTQEESELKLFNSNLENISEKFERLELMLFLSKQQENQEYLKQLTLLKTSMQSLEQVYKQLRFTTIASTVALTILLFWIGLTRQPSPAKSQQNITVIGSIVSTYSRS